MSGDNPVSCKPALSKDYPESQVIVPVRNWPLSSKSNHARVLSYTEEHQRRIYKRIVFNSLVQLAGHAYAIRLQGAV